jgi:hypothetical protein
VGDGAKGRWKRPTIFLSESVPWEVGVLADGGEPERVEGLSSLRTVLLGSRLIRSMQRERDADAGGTPRTAEPPTRTDSDGLNATLRCLVAVSALA